MIKKCYTYQTLEQDNSVSDSRLVEEEFLISRVSEVKGAEKQCSLVFMVKLLMERFSKDSLSWENMI